MTEQNKNEVSELGKKQIWHSGNKNSQFKHGMRNTRTYRIWSDMKRRCDSTKHIHYKYYGGRGVTYCEKWKNFMGFFEDMGHAPDGQEIDRVENELGYFKENCRWVTKNINMFNKKYPSKGLNPRGVDEVDGNFRARITIQGFRYNIGSFKTSEEASLAYKNVCLEWYGKLPPEKIK